MNRLYYIAAVGALAIFIAAIVGLASCGSDNSSLKPTQDAVTNAYQQGYLDGYSKGYAEGFAAGMESGGTEQTSYATPSRTGCATSSCATTSSTDTDEEEDDSEQDDT